MAAPANLSDVRDGRRIARLFRRARFPGDARRVDLDTLLEEDGIEVVESELENPGFDARLHRFESGGGILVPRNEDPGRRRFSIAHEMGHYHIPSHAKAGVQGACVDADLRAREHDAARREWEANDFATELLMPYRLFAPDADRLDVSVAAASQLAAPNMYDVSTMAAAWRIVQTTRMRAAVVVSVEERVAWMVRSEAWFMRLTERDQRVHGDTLAAAAFRGEGSVPGATAISMAAWLDSGALPSGELLESTYAIPRLGQVVSVLWHVDSGRAIDDD